MYLLVLGAASDIARETAKMFAKNEGANCYLAGRNPDALRLLATDLQIRYQVKAEPVFFDALNFGSHQAFYDALDPKPDGVILAFGLLGNQRECEADFDQAHRVIDSNFTGAVSIFEVIARDFESKGRGFIIGISSVAGIRGRKKNYFYGSAKAALAEYLSGLRQRLHSRRVRVMTVLPGFVRTHMTEGMDLPDKLAATPEEAAKDIYSGWKRGRHVVYTKWFWRYIMLVIRHLPEIVFKRISF